MDNSLFLKYQTVISTLSDGTFTDLRKLEDALLLERDGSLSVHYAPFDYINMAARVVIVGITPGRTQMLNALLEANKQLAPGSLPEDVCRAVKMAASFSGAMRPNLINLLDHVGVNRWLGIKSAESLFSTDARLVQTTSVLRYPVFVDGENYSGTPDMTGHPVLRRFLIDHFGQEAAQLKHAVFIPLGDKVAQALRFLAQRGIIDESHILEGMPHPSGANAERIAYFLGTKSRDALSRKTDPAKIESMRGRLIDKVLALGPA